MNQRKAESARQRIREDAELAKIVNYNLTATAFDLMKSLPTPVLSTGVCYYKRQLWTYCFEIHNLATQEAVTYIWNDYHWYHYIKSFVKTEKLIMYSDQYDGQNRNIKLSLMCNYITTSSEFKASQIVVDISIYPVTKILDWSKNQNCTIQTFTFPWLEKCNNNCTENKTIYSC